MELHEILAERRRNPEQNPRETPVDFLRKYKDDPTMYLHTGPILKVGIYPKSSDSHDSPTGIYAYRLMDIWGDDIERWNTGEYKRGLEFLSYHGGDHLFVLKSDIDPDFPRNFTEADLESAVAKMQQIYGVSDERIERLRKAARTNLNFQDCPAGYLWGMTKALVAGTYEFDEYTPVDTMKWNSLLRRLGFIGFNDPGFGIIHGAESTQALFLSTQAFKVVDHMLKKRQQNVVTIGDKKYAGGRVPKNLHMRGVDSVFFHNNKPEDFARVRVWTMDGLSPHDVFAFARFLPWNAQGIVGMVGFGNSDRELDQVRWFFNQKMPSRVTIESIYIGGRFPAMYLKYVPEDTPIKNIVISGFADTVGIDRLPASLQAKIKQQKFG